MIATADSFQSTDLEADSQDQSRFKSRKGALIWFFKKSRDNWKAKYAELKASEVKLRKKVAYLNEVREKELAAFTKMKEEFALLREEIDALKVRNCALEGKLASLNPTPDFFFGTSKSTA
jgi:chromosome segregation ATPase